MFSILFSSEKKEVLERLGSIKAIHVMMKKELCDPGNETTKKLIKAVIDDLNIIASDVAGIGGVHAMNDCCDGIITQVNELQQAEELRKSKLKLSPDMQKKYDELMLDLLTESFEGEDK